MAPKRSQKITINFFTFVTGVKHTSWCLLRPSYINMYMYGYSQIQGTSSKTTAQIWPVLSTRIWTLSPGLKNNHTLKCWFGIFPTTLTYMIMLENCQSNFLVYSCSLIQWTKFHSCWNLMKSGSQSGTYAWRKGRLFKRVGWGGVTELIMWLVKPFKASGCSKNTVVIQSIIQLLVVFLNATAQPKWWDLRQSYKVVFRTDSATPCLLISVISLFLIYCSCQSDATSCMSAAMAGARWSLQETNWEQRFREKHRIFNDIGVLGVISLYVLHVILCATIIESNEKRYQGNRQYNTRQKTTFWDEVILVSF